MFQDSITIQPQNIAELRGVSQILRRGSPTLLESGRSLVLMPEEQQLTTQRAAGLLGMSRPYLIQVLNDGEMPYQPVGKHRRIALRDVLTCAGRRAERRRAALDKMARDAFEAGRQD